MGLDETDLTGEGGPGGKDDTPFALIASYFRTMSDIESRRGGLGLGPSGGIRLVISNDVVEFKSAV